MERTQEQESDIHSRAADMAHEALRKAYGQHLDRERTNWQRIHHEVWLQEYMKFEKELKNG